MPKLCLAQQLHRMQSIFSAAARRPDAGKVRATVNAATVS